MKYWLVNWGFLAFLLFGVANPLVAQGEGEQLDSLVEITEIQPLDTLTKIALKSALRSAVVPTWGQINNGQTWKAAVFLPLMATGISVGIAGNRNFKTYNRAYNSRLLGETDDEFYGIYSDYALSEKVNLARKTRKLGFALAGTAYGLQIVDAYVFSLIAQKNNIHPPAKAAFLSAVVPGLGQAYNRKFWKLPIVYGALGVSGYFVWQNTQKHRAFKEAYVNYGVDGFVPESITRGFTQDGLLNGRQIYLRNLEVSWIITGALYVANILDAVVDAHLFDFDVSDDLSLQVQPILNTGGGFGASLSIGF